MRDLTKEDAERAEHLEHCAGYEDCDCFDERHSHCEVYELQQERNRMRAALIQIAGIAEIERHDNVEDHLQDALEEIANMAAKAITT